MPTEKANEFYRDLKKLAQGGEALLNEFIQKWLNQEKLTRLVGKNSKMTGEIVKRIQKYHDHVTTALKIPTKDDIANIAKLVMQSEDKLDLLDEQFEKLLTETLGKLSDEVESSSNLLERKTRTTLNSREANLEVLRKQLQVKLHESTSKMVENVMSQEAPIDLLKRKLKNRG